VEGKEQVSDPAASLVILLLVLPATNDLQKETVLSYSSLSCSNLQTEPTFYFNEAEKLYNMPSLSLVN
jgi:hypothetical protein